ncbi:MAG: EAL domain-containing protein [Paracoccaceae bacterium]
MADSHETITKCSDIPAIKSGTLMQQETRRVIHALADGRVQLFYQPVLRADTDNFIAFYEGLARIYMPDGSIVAAGQFMPFVENTQLGRALDCKALEIAVETLHAYPDIRLSVNLSAYSMSDPKWLNIFQSCAKDIGDRLILEITEGAAMTDIELTTAFMHRARQFGCSVALDDFGTGQTAFRYFRDFLFDIVKIDGLFIRDLPYNADNRVLVEALVKISQHFGMFSVAEYIETPEEARVASELGIDCLQGYLIGQPTAVPESPLLQTQTETRKIAG